MRNKPMPRDEARALLARALEFGDLSSAPDLFASGDALFDVSAAEFSESNPSRQYRPNPYALKFHNDHDAQLKVAMSPIGTGTTSMSIMDLIYYRPKFLYLPRMKRKIEEAKLTGAKVGNVVEAPVIVLRETKDEARRTFMETFAMIRPEQVNAEYRATDDKLITWMDIDGIRLRTTFTFAAYKVPPATAFNQFQSTYPCAVLIIEFQHASRELLEAAYSRIGRHDPGAHPVAPGVMMLEGNMPPPNAPVYNFFGGYPDSRIIGIAEPRNVPDDPRTVDLNCPPTCYGAKDLSEFGYVHEVRQGLQPDGTEIHDIRRVFHAPAGDSPFAINLPNTVDYTPDDPFRFYRKKKSAPLAMRCWMIYGIGAPEGQGIPVFPAFDMNTHILSADALDLHQGGDSYIITFDQGLSGGAILWLQRSTGVIALRECNANGVGPEAFAFDIADMFRELPAKSITAFGDPVSGNREARYDNKSFARLLTKHVSKHLGRPVTFRPLPSKDNSIRLRVHSSDEMLRQSCLHNKNRRMMFARNCEKTIAAMTEYMLRAEPQYNDRPQFIKDNDITSALGDCVTYMAVHLAHQRISNVDGTPFTFSRIPGAQKEESSTGNLDLDCGGY